MREQAVIAGWAQMHEPVAATRWRGPTLLLEASREKGRYVSAQTAAAIKAQLGNALDQRVLDVTHTIPADHPDLLASLVIEFLDRLDQARGPGSR